METACVHGRMAGDIRGIVCQRAESKGVLVRVLALQQQFSNEVTTSNVVHQIAELHTAKRIVAKVLYDSAAIGISVSFLHLVFRQAGNRFRRSGRSSSVQTRSTISSCVSTEYANEPLVQRNIAKRTGSTLTPQRTARLTETLSRG